MFYCQKSIPKGASTTIYAALAPQVIEEARSGEGYFYGNNKLGYPQVRANYAEGVGIEAWDLMEDMLM